MGKRSGWIPALILLAAAAGSPLGVSQQHPSTGDLPDGYMPGRADAKYGTYASVMHGEARSLQERLTELEKKAYGLSLLADEDPIEQSKAVYVLEHQIVRLNREIGNAPASSMSDFERQALLYGTARTYSDVRHHSERLFENMIRFIDQRLPGPNGLQIRNEVPGSILATYHSNFRSDEELTELQRQALYKKTLKEFLERGGSLSEMRRLDSDFLRKIRDYMQVEYVWLENGDILVTGGNAGHILLAQGKAVRSAGQLVFAKNQAGKFTLMIVSNASGSYKPDLLSAEKLSEVLQKTTGIAPELVVLTKGEPLSTQAVKIYMKGNGVKPEEIKKATDELKALGRAILDECASIFSAA